MNIQAHAANNADQPRVYEIRLKGHLGREWTDWFGGMAVALAEDGDALLIGPLADQAALHGLLRKVRDLGIPLISVNEIQPDISEVADGCAATSEISHSEGATA